MRCSKELAYAWGDMEETKVHILRDGRVRMRRAKGKEHALESFRIIERTVIGATICNCCGHDLFSVLAGLAPTSKEESHTVLEAGSTLSIDSKQMEWTLKNQSMEVELGKRMVNLIEPIYIDLASQLDLMISGDFTTESTLDPRPQICKFISLMLESSAQDYVTVFLKGLAHALFLENALRGLAEIRYLIHEQQVDTSFVIELLKNTRKKSLSDYETTSLDSSLILLVAHATRVARGLSLYEKWI
jgi:hypothetical protein